MKWEGNIFRCLGKSTWNFGAHRVSDFLSSRSMYQVAFKAMNPRIRNAHWVGRECNKGVYAKEGQKEEEGRRERWRERRREGQIVSRREGGKVRGREEGRGREREREWRKEGMDGGKAKGERGMKCLFPTSVFSYLSSALNSLLHFLISPTLNKGAMQKGKKKREKQRAKKIKKGIISLWLHLHFARKVTSQRDSRSCCKCHYSGKIRLKKAKRPSLVTPIIPPLERGYKN